MKQRSISRRYRIEARRSHDVARALSNLRDELEVTELGEQLCRFRKRIALSRFYDFYDKAQANPSAFLPQDPRTVRETSILSSNNGTLKQAPRLSSVVLSHIVDLMFPNTVPTHEEVMTASDEAQRTLTERQRKTAARKVEDWRKIGKPWSAMIRRFGEGISAPVTTEPV